MPVISILKDFGGFGGLANEKQALAYPPNYFSTCNNYLSIGTKQATPFIGALSKPTIFTASGNQQGTANCRGIYFFRFSTGWSNENMLLQVIDDGTNRKFQYNNAGTWTNILSTVGGRYSRAKPVYWDERGILIIPLGHGNYGGATIYKFIPEWKAIGVGTMVDKSGTAVALAGTLTFNSASAAVTGAGTSFTTELQIGDWIRKSSSDAWDEIKTITDNTNLVLREYSNSNGAGGAGTSQRAERISTTTSIYTNYRYIEKFNKQLFLFYKRAASTSTLIGPTELRWTVLGDYDDFSGSGAGYTNLEIPDSGEGTGIYNLKDKYLFVFFEKAYAVYRWTGDVDFPLQLVNSMPYGCNSNETICEVEGFLYYYTGYEVRRTNGFTDELLPGLNSSFIDSSELTTRDYLGSNSAPSSPNAYPTAIADIWNNMYRLVTRVVAGYAAKMLNYNYKDNMWTIEDRAFGAMYYDFFSQTIYAGTSASNGYSYSSSQYGYDKSLNGTIVTCPFTAKYFGGNSGSRVKIEWVEIDIYQHAFCNSAFTFGYYKDLQHVSSSVLGSQSQSSNSGSKAKVLTLHFEVQDIMNYFQIYFADTPTTAGHSIIDIRVKGVPVEDEKYLVNN